MHVTANVINQFSHAVTLLDNEINRKRIFHYTFTPLNVVGSLLKVLSLILQQPIHFHFIGTHIVCGCVEIGVFLLQIYVCDKDEPSKKLSSKIRFTTLKRGGKFT